MMAKTRDMQYRVSVRAIVVAVLLGLVSNISSCHGQGTKYSGEWLASALDMNTPDKASEAMGLNNLNGAEQQASNNIKATAIDENSFANKRSPYLKLTESGNYDEALAMINKHIEGASAESDGSQDVANLEMLYLMFDKLQVLRRANRSIEALIEAQKLLYRMKKLGMSHPKSSHFNLCLSLNKFISQTDAELSIRDDYHRMQLDSGASWADIKKSYKHLMLILHPDKYSELDEAGEAYVYDLYFKVKASFEALKSGI